MNQNNLRLLAHIHAMSIHNSFTALGFDIHEIDSCSCCIEYGSDWSLQVHDILRDLQSGPVAVLVTPPLSAMGGTHDEEQLAFWFSDADKFNSETRKTGINRC